MGETEMKKVGIGSPKMNGNGRKKVFDPSFLVRLPHKLQNGIKSQFMKLKKTNEELNSVRKEKESPADLGLNLEEQLQVWRENPSWAGAAQPPEIKVTVPKGSLCNLSCKLDVGLPPDAVYNIVTDPDNRRVFKNIKEVKSRNVLVDEGHRQLVELEQAALWKFLWWSGTISVHVLVDQNRNDHTMKFTQLKTGFMEKFEGEWRVEPLFVDEKICYPFKPKTLAEYYSCTGGKGRIGSKVNLEQLIQPSIVPPPPISWYLRGITAKTTEMIANDLVIEAARISSDLNYVNPAALETSDSLNDECPNKQSLDIKERWALQRRNAKNMRRRFLSAK